MQFLSYTNSKGQTIDLLSDPGLALIDVQGLTPPTTQFALSTRVGFDGVIINAASLPARNIVFVTQLQGDAEAHRKRLMDVFKIKQAGTLSVHTSTLSVQIEAWVEKIEIPPMVWPVRALVSLLCPQPSFSALSETLKEITVTTKALSFPLEIPASRLHLGTIEPSEAQNIVNPGDLSIGMTIRFHAIGNVINPKLLNTITLEFIELELELVSGDEVIVCTEAGRKRIELTRAGSTTNQFYSMVLGSTFLQLAEGDNVLYATAQSGASFLLTQVAYRPQYSGV